MEMDSAVFHEMQAEDRRGRMLLQGMPDDVTAAACHPHDCLVAIACYNGVLQLWDYEDKTLLAVREFSEESKDASITRRGMGRTQTKRECVL